ncbi:6-O-methylguanine DNA methyltransferase [Streptomyces davaonensis JCM 4913]|uniref:6-O-methylguanine DNA methyltransferase n=1 Tax=Streptomyces davaonensis (strain DSM 101723 / JCM 4913 / KCC S-0913 / 768) TaxID=1214101 RepID=K4QUR4_STRDJ|nr:class I SAM-dependent methyltransferase [Streptomyces davaonensis]CCK24515.1 6-O-methylguanine DNA methyltransferase [Streptomyces davaonensis JCM 4913]
MPTSYQLRATTHQLHARNLTDHTATEAALGHTDDQLEHHLAANGAGFLDGSALRCGSRLASYLVRRRRGVGMAVDRQEELAEAQREHWQQTYGEHPGMYGEEPSAPAVHAAAVFRSAGAREVLELGAGHGRDALHFARQGLSVLATDFSPVALEQLREAAASQQVAENVTTAVHDVREPLPLADASVDAVFAHMLLCMALSTPQIHALVA